ncbi:ATP-binding protein [Candidatus Woesearchaeota archaeon]|nr:ATP-binding protein [Candidatus Woesearchaeota archaeon]
MAALDSIKSAIADREDELEQKFRQEHIIGREAASNIQLHTDTALVVTGIRRCGKSILAYMLSKGQKSAYVNFEDERLNIPASDLNIVMEAIHALKGDVDVCIFDEIQNIVGWERFVVRLLTTKKIVITGSNARLLSKELATFLTGRHRDVRLFPFSFREFCSWRGLTPSDRTKDIAQAKTYLQEYLEKGGFPLAYTLGNVFLVDLYKDILERDILQRYKIRHAKVLNDLAKYLVSHHSRELSYNQLRKVFAVKSVNTVKNYILYLQNAYLVLLVERFSFKLKEQALAPRKSYCIDTGIIRAVGFQSSENRGFLMENLVAVELWRRNKELYYWKDHQQREVDFILKEGKGVVQLIQVCADITHIETKQREIKALLVASRELRCNEMLVITSDYEGREQHERKIIHFIPLWKWLLK